MEAIEKFVNRENIARFSTLYEVEVDPRRKRLLQELLLLEEEKYGFYSEQEELVRWRLRESTARIAKQRDLIEQIRLNRNDSSEAERLLENMTALRDLFLLFEARIEKELARIRL